MFFTEQKKHFFRPFSGKYREQVMECLKTLHARLYGDQADYSRAFTQEQLLETFQEAIARAPVLDEDDENEFCAPSRNEREQANWVRNTLLENGWLEKHADETTLQSTYAFSRVGRLFTQPMVEMDGRGFRTRHRNTRNTRNALQSFLERGEVYDLLDAYEASARIISDFSDVIAELDERKRQLIKDVEAQQLIQQASDEFFDFMEQRFMPDLAIRLSADSVEKHREEIQQLIAKARRKHNAFKAQAEGELRKMAPELLSTKNTSIYMRILDGIDSRMHKASESMLPALRQALLSFTRRADIIIRQLSYSSYGDQGGLPALCQSLSEMSTPEKQEKLQTMGDAMSGLSMGFVDPATLQLNNTMRRRMVNTKVENQQPLDQAARKALFIQQVLEKAFQVNNQEQVQFIMNALQNGHRIRSQHLPVNNARELLMSAHAIEIAAAGNDSSEFEFRVHYNKQTISTEYYRQTDEFIIELVEKQTEAIKQNAN